MTLTESTQKTNPSQRGLKERKDRATMDYDNQYNDRPQYDRYSDGAYDDRPPRPQADPPLITEKIVTERKVFFLDLKENSRGRVLKITEDVRGRRDTIMVPVETLIDFYEAIGRIIDYERTV